MVPNLLVLLGASFIPFFIGYAWFHPKTFGGDTWKKLAGLSDEQNNKAISPLKMGLSIFFNFLLAFLLFNLTVHSFSVLGLVGGDPELLKTGTGAAFMAEYGTNHLSFGHGIVHGIIGAITVALPLLGYATIWERKSGKYLLVNFAFWLISMALMGGVICQWGWNAV